MAGNATIYLKSPGNSYTVGFSSMMHASGIMRMNFGPKYTMKGGQAFIQIARGFPTTKYYVGTPAAMDMSIYTGAKIDFMQANIASNAAKVVAVGGTIVGGGLAYLTGAAAAVALGTVNETIGVVHLGVGAFTNRVGLTSNF